VAECSNRRKAVVLAFPRPFTGKYKPVHIETLCEILSRSIDLYRKDLGRL